MEINRSSFDVSVSGFFFFFCIINYRANHLLVHIWKKKTNSQLDKRNGMLIIIVFFVRLVLI